MKIYLAGGMSKLTFRAQNAWRMVVKESLLRMDNAPEVINPVEYYNFESVDYKTQREVMEFDLYNVRRSDIVVVNFNEPSSIGTAMELAVARENHIPIIGLNDENNDLHPWLVEHCTRMCDSMAELITHITDFYLS